MQKRLKPEHLYCIESIESPVISPNGRTAAYVLKTYDRDKEESQTHIELAGRQRGRQLTAGPKDSRPAWSPDGKQIAFISGRTGKPQIHLIATDGGEARHIETEKKPASPLSWSPDGKRIAFRATVKEPVDGPRYPGEPKELLPREDDQESENGNGKSKKDEKKKACRVITDMHYRTDMDGFTYDRRPQLFVLDVESEKVEQLTDAFRQHGEMCWHPKGERIAYTVRHYDDQRVVYTSSIREVDLDTGNHQRLLEWDGTVNDLSYSPDGRWLVFSATENRDPMGTANAHLWALNIHDRALPASAHDACDLTPDLDRSVMGRFRWDPSGERLYFTVGDCGRILLRRTAFDDGRPQDIVPIRCTLGGVISDLDIAAETGELMYKAQDFAHPEQLFIQDDEGAEKITSVNEDLLSDYDLQAPESFTYEGPDGWKIQGWVMKPAGYEAGRRYPTVLSIHGGPTGAYLDRFDFSFQMLAHQGFAVVFTNPRGSVTYGTRFAQGVVKDWGGRDYQDIMTGLDTVIEEGIADPERLGVMGWSYGGYMTCWTVTQTKRFAAAVAGANISNIYTLWGTSDIAPVYNQALNGAPPFDDEEQYMNRSAMRHIRNVTTPVLVLHGEADVRTPISQSEQFFVGLKRLGREAVFVRYPDQHHGFARLDFTVDRWRRTLGWFQHHLLNSDGKEGE
ncbi:MAG: S9 family peptidase [Bacillota bacterium]